MFFCLRSIFRNFTLPFIFAMYVSWNWCEKVFEKPLNPSEVIVKISLFFFDDRPPWCLEISRTGWSYMLRLYDKAIVWVWKSAKFTVTISILLMFKDWTSVLLSVTPFIAFLYFYGMSEQSEFILSLHISLLKCNLFKCLCQWFL